MLNPEADGLRFRVFTTTPLNTLLAAECSGSWQSALRPLSGLPEGVVRDLGLGGSAFRGMYGGKIVVDVALSWCWLGNSTTLGQQSCQILCSSTRRYWDSGWQARFQSTPGEKL